MNYFAIFIIFITIANLCKSQPIEYSELQCYDSNGWQEPGYLPTNMTTCYNENCYGITGYIDKQTPNRHLLGKYESYGCGAPEGWNRGDLGLFLELCTKKYKTNTGNSSSNVFMQAAGFTFRGSSQAENSKALWDSFQQLHTHSLSAISEVTMNIDGVQLMAKFSAFGIIPDEGPYDLSVTACFAQIGCKEMELFKGENRFDPDWVFKQFLNYKDLTLTIKGKAQWPVKLEFWIYGNPEPVIKKIDHSIKTRNDDIFNIEVNYEDHITIENIEKNHAKNQLTSYGMGSVKNLEPFIDMIFIYPNPLDSKVKNFAANICIEGDCSQLGACSKTLCNTQENFIDMASDSSFATKASMKSVQDNLVFWTHSFFSMFPF